LNLTWDDITSSGIEAVVTSCKQLAVLDLTKCSKVDDQALSHIATHATNLLRLEIIKCPLVTSTGIKEVKSKLPAIQIQLLDYQATELESNNTLTILPTNVDAFWVLNSNGIIQWKSMLRSRSYGTIWSRNLCYDLNKSVTVMEATVKALHPDVEIMFGFSANKCDWNSGKADALTFRIGCTDNEYVASFKTQYL
jgi:hypothetical protein